MTRTSLALAAVLCFSGAPMAMGQQIDFGDDTSEYARDGECDDPRFTGPGMAESTNQDNTLADATDCRTAQQAGRIRLVRTREEADIAECATIDFGNNSSMWANDGECDDPRFTGGDVDEILLPDDRAADAADCRALCEAGRIWLR